MNVVVITLVLIVLIEALGTIIAQTLHKEAA